MLSFKLKTPNFNLPDFVFVKNIIGFFVPGLNGNAGHMYGKSHNNDYKKDGNDKK